MQDCFGTELKVGDKVIFPVLLKTHTGYVTGTKMCKGTITKLFKVMVEINGNIRKKTNNVVKVGE